MVERKPAPGDVASVPSDKEIAALLDGLDLSRRRSGAAAGVNLIGILQQVQERFGYLPPACLEQISIHTGLPLSRIYGVVSFYSQFYTEPRGRHTIRCCRGTACHVKGAARILDAIRRTLKIDEGQTTPDMFFYLETVACLGTCFLAPAMMIDTQYFGRLTPQRVHSILKSFQAKES